MKRLGALTCVAVTSFAALAATVRLAAQEPQPNTSINQQAQSFAVLHSFSGSDGANPFQSVNMDALGNLYSTTINGGAYGNGTVFKLDPFGHQTVLYSFMGGTDGQWPYAGVIMDASGNLYGTTHSGGTYGNGTVFRLDPVGNETVLHSFSGSDGSVPLGPLLMDRAGNLYGTTYVGGTYGDGAVFKLDTSGNETVLYNFTGPDGEGPYAGVIMDASGNLYGTTSKGGGSSNCGGAGCGTVFKLDTSGHETVLHSFSGSDGWAPYGNLIMDRKGNLYGTTGLGGGSNYCSNGCGTVFKLDTAGNHKVLHIFAGGVEGVIPLAGLVRGVSGTLYGTTATGGVGGGGTVFELYKSGHVTVLHSFTDSDLAYSYGSLLMDKSRNIYGTTFWGGSSANCFNGCGTVFKIGARAPRR